MSDLAIYNAMTAKLKASSLNLPIAFADTKYKPPNGSKEWIELVFLPDEKGKFTAPFGGKAIYSGLFNINYVQRPNQGAPTALERSKQVEDLFAEGEQLGPVCIVGKPSLTVPFFDNDRSTYPVRVRYQGLI